VVKGTKICAAVDINGSVIAASTVTAIYKDGLGIKLDQNAYFNPLKAVVAAIDVIKAVSHGFDRALTGIVQLLYREDPYVDIILQEQIKTDYDVRVIVASGKIMGAMKRPIIQGDFRSNVSQGSEPEIHKLTELEKTESIRAAESVGGTIVGVDFIPAKNREKEKPFFIEVNSTPGLTGIEGAVKMKSSKKSITTDILNNMKTILSTIEKEKENR